MPLTSGRQPVGRSLTLASRLQRCCRRRRRRRRSYKRASERTSEQAIKPRERPLACARDGRWRREDERLRERELELDVPSRLHACNRRCRRSRKRSQLPQLVVAGRRSARRRRRARWLPLDFVCAPLSLLRSVDVDRSWINARALVIHACWRAVEPPGRLQSLRRRHLPLLAVARRHKIVALSRRRRRCRHCSRESRRSASLRASGKSLVCCSNKRTVFFSTSLLTRTIKRLYVSARAAIGVSLRLRLHARARSNTRRLIDNFERRRRHRRRWRRLEGRRLSEQASERTNERARARRAR